MPEDSFCEEELAEKARMREEAEANGLYDDPSFFDAMEQPAKELKLNLTQEMALHSAVSDLSNLMKETNSSMSDLLKMGGLTND